ncbi:hypothetical protein F5890DRAFT_1565666 [Lentinula detonsa]|uniref:Uncharacterized protein n=1 Tax=Lentinula detonsa TaxID=2804962 RepID=A0AA38PZ96_9AGAR|nr:hypothetical protein F5890DRAFT_1565666 [Lentinula detonsa]
MLLSPLRLFSTVLLFSTLSILMAAPVELNATAKITEGLQKRKSALNHIGVTLKRVVNAESSSPELLRQTTDNVEAVYVTETWTLVIGRDNAYRAVPDPQRPSHYKGHRFKERFAGRPIAYVDFHTLENKMEIYKALTSLTATTNLLYLQEIFNYLLASGALAEIPAEWSDLYIRMLNLRGDALGHQLDY